MNKKEELNKKNKCELENSIRRKNGITYFTMQDYYNMILLNEFSDAEIEKMLNCKNLLEKLAILLLDDSRFASLQEEILREYLQR